MCVWMQHGVHLATAAATNDQKLHCHFYAQFVLRKYCESFWGEPAAERQSDSCTDGQECWHRLPRWRHLAKLRTNVCVRACVCARANCQRQMATNVLYIFICCMCVDFWLLYNISFNAQLQQRHQKESVCLTSRSPPLYSTLCLNLIIRNLCWARPNAVSTNRLASRRKTKERKMHFPKQRNIEIMANLF